MLAWTQSNIDYDKHIHIPTIYQDAWLTVEEREQCTVSHEWHAAPALQHPVIAHQGGDQKQTLRHTDTDTDMERQIRIISILGRDPLLMERMNHFQGPWLFYKERRTSVPCIALMSYVNDCKRNSKCHISVIFTRYVRVCPV